MFLITDPLIIYSQLANQPWYKSLNAVQHNLVLYKFLARHLRYDNCVLHNCPLLMENRQNDKIEEPIIYKQTTEKNSINIQT